MKQIRKRLTYANVMSSIAVFLILGGATAIAANQLGKNSVGSKQIKKNAVTSAKIKNNAVTSSKIKNGAITGAKVNVGSLGTVPNATHANSADTADSANSANSAGNANTVAGQTIRKFFFARNEGAGETVILQLNGLTLTASCEGGTPSLLATTSVDGLIHSGGTFGTEGFENEDDSFEPGDTEELLGETDSVQGTFTYVRQDGGAVSGIFESEDEGLVSPEFDCVIAGNAIG